MPFPAPPGPRTAIVFGDELGLPVALAALPPGTRAVAVVDPRRAGAGDGLAVPVLHHPDKAGRAVFEATVAGLRPTLGVVFSYSRILWPELLALFPHGVVNLHNSRLPEYRGANTLQWTLINGETETASTLHYVDAGIDSGPVIDAIPVPILDTDDAATLRDALSGAARTLLERWLGRLLDGPVPAQPQTGERARHWPRRHPADGRIDWSWPDERIRNLTRALVPPWPGAYAEGPDGTVIRVDRALSLDEVRALRRFCGG